MRTYVCAYMRTSPKFSGRGMALRAREEILRALGLTTIVMITVLILATPAIAQGSRTDAGAAGASSQQYGGVHSSESLADVVRDVSDTAGRGADAVNGALTDPQSPDGAADSPSGKVGGLTELPETGGASLLVPGVLLVGAGLLVRRIIR